MLRIKRIRIRKRKRLRIRKTVNKFNKFFIETFIVFFWTALKKAFGLTLMFPGKQLSRVRAGKTTK